MAFWRLVNAYPGESVDYASKLGITDPILAFDCNQAVRLRLYYERKLRKDDDPDSCPARDSLPPRRRTDTSQAAQDEFWESLGNNIAFTG